MTLNVSSSFHHYYFFFSPLACVYLCLTVSASVRRQQLGRFIGEAKRVNTASVAHLPPAYYAALNWTEAHTKNKEHYGPEPGSMSSFYTLEERVSKVYMVPAGNAGAGLDTHHRRLDFSKQVVVLHDGGGGKGGDARVEPVVVRGSTENPHGVLVIKDNELFVQEEHALPSWEDIVTTHLEDAELARKAAAKHKPLQADFLNEIDYQSGAEDTPGVDYI